MTTSTYERVLRNLKAGKSVSVADLADAWRQCPTNYPPKELREYTAKLIEERYSRKVNLN